MALRFSSLQPSRPTLQTQLWLVAAVFASCLAERWTVPLLHLSFPVLMLLYLRSQPAGRGFVLAWLTQSLAWTLTMADFAPFMNQTDWTVTAFASCLLGLLPYLADRVLHTRLPTTLATLVLPSALVSADFLRHLSDPSGSYGMLGYGIGADNPLAQLAAITGVDGISFVLAWGAAIAATVILQRQQWPGLRPLVQCYSVGLALVIGWGLLASRLNLLGELPEQASQVRVATIARKHDPAVADQQNLDDWLALSQQQARQGAKIIVWAEGALPIASAQEDAAIRAGQQLAKTEQVHLVMALFHLDRPFADKRHNKLIWIDPQGLIRTVYHKNHGQFAEQTIAGDGKLAVVDTPWGRFGLSICWDADFPGFIRQAANQQVDVLINPSYDYPAVTNGRAEIARYRAIENGVALIRPNNNGLNLIADANGRILGSQRNQQHEPVLLLTDLQLQRRATPYRQLGNTVSLLSALGFAALLVLAWRQHRRQQRVRAAIAATQS